MDASPGTSSQGKLGRVSTNRRFSVCQFISNIHWLGAGHRHYQQRREQHHLVQSPSVSLPVEEDVVSMDVMDIAKIRSVQCIIHLPNLSDFDVDVGLLHS